ncbi:SUMF1/EgtB/PvdO family nonheme iron enzyme [Candidatus Poribacteria bacterium]|nr:SUMF1/EgtB/PvdO family nonheme iron enzyme [Candidatus Poribacteria bacterium]
MALSVQLLYFFTFERRRLLKQKLYSIAIILVYLFVISMVGCGEDDSVEFQSVNPADGSTIPTDATITVNFSGTPQNLSVSKGEVVTSDNTATISGPFPLGMLEIELTWEGGNRRLTYTVDDQVGEPVVPEGMVLIPEGEFQLGSVSGEEGNVEQSGHTVYLDAFYMDKYEVTNAEYKKFVDANSEWQKDRIDSKFHDGNYLANWDGNTYPSDKADHPVVSVSWYGAAAYAKWVEKRLPTEAEWEKAARGGVEGQKYPWGNSIDDSKANYSLNVGHTGNTKPVGDYPSNGYDLYDIVGNVLEWCLDAYDKDFHENPPDNNPIAGGDSIAEVVDNFENIKSSRSIRGGSWVESGQPRVWITYRRGNEPARTSRLIGFRCVKPVTLE